MVLAIAATASAARAEPSPSYATGAFTLSVGTTQAGWVRSVEGDAPREDGAVLVAVRFDTLSPALTRVVTSWLGGKVQRTDFALVSAAVMRKAPGARIASVRLPAIGFGAPAPVEIAFEAKSFATAPVLTPASDRAVPQGDRVASFHVELAGKATRVVKLGEVTLKRGANGVAPAEVTLEVAAGATQPWRAWAKTPGTKSVQVDYVTSDERSILKVTLDGCRPTSIKPTNGPTTRVVVACQSAR
jgi:hypothetical protein